MSDYVENDKPPENSEGLLKSFDTADKHHNVFGQYGEAVGSFYNVQTPLEIDNKSVSGWLALPMHDSSSALTGIAFISPDPKERIIFYPHGYPKGSVVFGKPSKDKPIFIFSSQQAAFAASLTGLPCLLTFTPNDYGGKNSPEPKDAGNMAHIIKSWSVAGYARIYAPVGIDRASTYKLWLKDLSVQVLPLAAPIDQYMITPALKAELLAGVESVATNVDTDGVDTNSNEAETSNELTEDEVNRAIEELAELSKLQYDRVRKAEAKRLGVSLSFLDKEIKKIQSGNDDSKQGSAISFFCDSLEPHIDRVDACELFDYIEAMIVKPHTIAEPVFQHYVTLWGVATWFIDAFRAVPYLHITAPLKNSGKSNLLDVVSSYSYRPLAASDITGSALFRVIEMCRPTLFIDEVDELSGKADSNGLTGLLNDGYKSTGRVVRCVGDNHEPRQFNVFGFKALCGIGQLSKSTTASRCVKVSVRPMVTGEHIQDILYVSTDLLEEINSKLKRLQIDYFDDVVAYDGRHVTHLINRDKQIWSAIYAIAALGGDKWINRLKCAERVINDRRVEVLDDKIQLLADIKQVFESKRMDGIHTAELLEHLCLNDDSLWRTWTNGKALDSKQLAALLSDFGIGSKNVRMGQLQKKGYKLEDFKESFNRYLKHVHDVTPNSAVPPSQVNDSKAYSPETPVPPNPFGTAEKPLEPLQTKGWDGGTAEIPLKAGDVKNGHFGTATGWSDAV
jgi:hypothetical protein